MKRCTSAIKVDLNVHIFPKSTSILPSVDISQPTWPHLDGLTLADPHFYESGKIELLFGSDIYGQLLEGSLVNSSPNAPVTWLTKFGWIPSRPSIIMTEDPELKVQHCSIDERFHTLLERFWWQEEIYSSSTKTLSPENQACEDHFKNTHSRDQLGRYTVRLHFKKPLSELGNLEPTSLQMLARTQKRVISYPKYAKAYSSFLNEYDHVNH